MIRYNIIKIKIILKLIFKNKNYFKSIYYILCFIFYIIIIKVKFYI